MESIYFFLVQEIYQIELQINLLIFLTFLLLVFTFYNLINSEFATKIIIFFLLIGIVIYSENIISAINLEINFCLLFLDSCNIFEPKIISELFYFELHIQIIKIIQISIIIINFILLLAEIV